MAGGWVWVEGTINAPAKDVFGYFADDTDKLPYLLPSTRVIQVLERTRLANGGQRVRVLLNIGQRQHDVVSEDTEYEPYTLLRGWSAGPTGTVEAEKRFSEANGRTRMGWGYRVTGRKRFLSRLIGRLMPSNAQLAMRLALFGVLARARAALEPFPQGQTATEPAWLGVHVPPPVSVRFGWATTAVWGIGFGAALIAIAIASIVWPAVASDWRLEAASVIPFTAVLLLLVEGLSWAALRALPSSLPDT